MALQVTFPAPLELMDWWNEPPDEVARLRRAEALRKSAAMSGECLQALSAWPVITD
jgi:hypothetical protein